MKILKERNETVINQESKATEFFQNLSDNSLWEAVDAEDVRAKEIPYCPIMAEDIKKTVGVSEDVSTDSVQENMEENLCLGLKYPGGFYPLGETGFLSALQRAGYMQSVALSGREEKSNFRPMTPEERVIVLNIGLKTQKNKTFIVLLRDEKIRYVGSSEYVPLDFGKLMRLLRESLEEDFEEVAFAGATASHEYFTVFYNLTSAEFEDRFKFILKDSGIITDNVKIRVKLVSSDVGLSAASIYPYLTINGEERIIGKPISLEHKGEADYHGFLANTKEVYSLFKESEEKMEEMEMKRMRHPAGALRRLCKAAGLPKKQSLEAAENFEEIFINPSQLDVYWAAYEVYESAREDSTFSTAKKLLVEEALARAIYSMDDYDYPFDWI